MSKPVFHLKRTYLFMRKRFDERLREHQLTTSQFEVLGSLYQNSPMDQQVLQHKSGVTSATLTGILDKLEDRKCLVRTSSPNDARAKQVSLTAQGEELFSHLINMVEEFEGMMLRGFSAAERLLLTDWLERIASNLGDGGN